MRNGVVSWSAVPALRSKCNRLVRLSSLILASGQHVPQFCRKESVIPWSAIPIERLRYLCVTPYIANQTAPGSVACCRALHAYAALIVQRCSELARKKCRIITTSAKAQSIGPQGIDAENGSAQRSFFPAASMERCIPLVRKVIPISKTQ